MPIKTAHTISFTADFHDPKTIARNSKPRPISTSPTEGVSMFPAEQNLSSKRRSSAPPLTERVLETYPTHSPENNFYFPQY